MLRKAFKSVDAKGKDFAGMKFTVQIAPEDCTGCGACVDNLPRGANVTPRRNRPVARPSTWNCKSRFRDRERANYDYFLSIPNTDRSQVQGRHGQGQPVDSSRCSSIPVPVPVVVRRAYVKLLYAALRRPRL